MSNTPHELAEEFPDLTEQMHALKTSDAHFARLADEYHEINREIHRIETNVEPASPVHESELRKQRMTLKDEIYKMLTEAA
ncbi:YdcH family protein [Hyphomonas sp. FCG-A18]|jgi:hypothetical protein|uniref:YdcH family protein n=1 Tax=Hyphomonas sp. FCG-A18 TaxID=3080019 RepID=UPI002B30098E|nr:YdcH family protein [Hyphomonas sp. FCG-A18]